MQFSISSVTIYHLSRHRPPQHSGFPHHGTAKQFLLQRAIPAIMAVANEAEESDPAGLYEEAEV